MFQRAKKKQEEERIIDYIIQTYADESELTQRLLHFVNHQSGFKTERNEILVSLDRYNTLLYETTLFDRFKKQLFGADKDLQVLTYMELSVCFLLNTRKYYPEAVVDVLWIDRERLCGVVQSLERKMAAGGYRLPKGYKVMQHTIYEYCGI